MICCWLTPFSLHSIVLTHFVVDSTAYFGILTLMTTYPGHDLGWGDVYAAATLSLFTMLVTLAMLGIGSVAESFGLRRAILAGLVVAAVGRAIYCLAPDASGTAATACMAIFGLLLVAGSSGILQPVCYSGVKQFTDEKTSSMGYAVMFGLPLGACPAETRRSGRATPAVNHLVFVDRRWRPWRVARVLDQPGCRGFQQRLESCRDLQ